MRIYTLTVLLLRARAFWRWAKRAIATGSLPFSASWRNVLEGRVAGSALPKTKHTDVASPHSSENRPGSTATPGGVANNRALLALYAYAPRVLYFSAFHIIYAVLLKWRTSRYILNIPSSSVALRVIPHLSSVPYKVCVTTVPS